MDNKVFIEGSILDVTTLDNYIKNKEVYRNGGAIVYDQYILPVRTSKTEDKVGVYEDAIFTKFYVPEDEQEKSDYSIDNMVSFDDISTYSDIVKKSQILNNQQNEYFSGVDNIFDPPIYDNDTPIMIALKDATKSKNIDLNKYSQRFGTNFNNDKRLFNKNSITLDKFLTIATNLDMKVSLTIEDKDKDVPNPIGRKITVDLIDGKKDE